MGTLSRQTPNNGYPFPPKWPLKMGTGLAASAAHPRRNQIWVPPPPPRGLKDVIEGRMEGKRPRGTMKMLDDIRGKYLYYVKSWGKGSGYKFGWTILYKTCYSISRQREYIIMYISLKAIFIQTTEQIPLYTKQKTYQVVTSKLISNAFKGPI